MAKKTKSKGKQSLLETTDSRDIIKTDEEVGSIPYFIIDKEYGVACDNLCYTLVVKKIACRRGKKDNDEDTSKVYKYIRWEDLGYLDSFESVIKMYAEVKEKRLNRKLIKSQDLQDIKDIRRSIKNDIKKALSTKSDDNQIEEVCGLVDAINKLREDIRVAKNQLSELNQLNKDTTKELKKARKIVVDVNKIKAKGD